MNVLPVGLDDLIHAILGIEERDGVPVLPPAGLEGLDLDEVQRDIRGHCRTIDPEYQPVLAPEVYEGKPIFVIWAPAGDVRPYQAPEHSGKGAARRYWVRLGRETVEARGEILSQLMQLTAKVPFDDRRRPDVPLSAVTSSRLAGFLGEIGSEVATNGALDVADVLRRLRLSARVNSVEGPRNVALLFFADDLEAYFPGARFEVAQFRDDAGGDLIEVRTFRGPLPQQIRHTLDYLTGLSGEMLRKVPGQAEAERYVAFPYEAMEEAVVNAVYHRGYDAPPQPVRVALYPDRLEITSYPGPVPGLRRQHLEAGAHPPQLPPRNPRVGELLKSLRLAETWLTGIPKIRRRMAQNGSPPPVFDFDDGRTYFRVTLPAHPGYVVAHAVREAAAIWHTGDRDRALAHLKEARQRVPQSGAPATQLVEYATPVDDLDLASQVVSELEQIGGAADAHLAYQALARAYLDRDRRAEAEDLLARVPVPPRAGEVVSLAILHKRSGNLERAHQLFASVEATIQNDPKALHEFAQTKIGLTARIQSRRPQDRYARDRLNREAAEMLRRVIALAPEQPTRAAWAWFDLARVLAWLGEPDGEVRRACERAIDLAPGERRFQDWLRRRDG